MLSDSAPCVQDKPQQPEERERELCCSCWVNLLADMRVQAEKAGAQEEGCTSTEGCAAFDTPAACLWSLYVRCAASAAAAVMLQLSLRPPSALPVSQRYV